MVTPMMVVVMMVTPRAVVVSLRFALCDMNSVQTFLASVLGGRSVDHGTVNRCATLTTTAGFGVRGRVGRSGWREVRVDVLHGLVIRRRWTLPPAGKGRAQEGEETGGRSEK